MGEVWEWVGEGVTPGLSDSELLLQCCIGPLPPKRCEELTLSFRMSVIVRGEPRVGVEIAGLLSATEACGRANVDDMAVCDGVKTVEAVLLR